MLGRAAHFVVYLTLQPLLICGETVILAPNVAVGNRLEAAVSVVLQAPLPNHLINVTLRSEDSEKLRISLSPDSPGAAQQVVPICQGCRESRQFWLQGLASSGTVRYSAEAPEFGTAFGTVTLTPSAVILASALRTSKVATTSGAFEWPLVVSSVRLDSAFQYVEEQPLSGGQAVRIDLVSSNSRVGVVTASPLEIRGGTISVNAAFRPLAEGETTLSLGVSAEFRGNCCSTIPVVVTKPGLAVSNHVSIGRNLQIGGVLSLGQLAPKGGVEIVLESKDPRLLLSSSLTEVGSQTLILKIPEGQVTGRYFLQSLADSGTVEYTASGLGYRTGVGNVILAPAGILFTPAALGPPDEAQLFRKTPPDVTTQFVANLTDPAPSSLVAWTAQLDPESHRAADITVQPLRAGISITIPLLNSDKAVGRVASSVTIASGSDHGVTDFMPLTLGSTEIVVVSPKDFTRPANSTKIDIVVRK